MKHFLAALLILCAAHLGRSAESTRPNILYILADDLGIANVSCYGADNFKTPNIDKLATGGIRFQRCFAAPLCGPSRALILTGRYAFRTGMTGNGSGANLKLANETMIPKLLKPAGYVTGCFGKWGQLPFQPGDWGFDEYMRFANSGVYWLGVKNSSYIVNGKSHELAKGKYMPDLVHEHVIDFIRKHKDQPFFAYYSMSHVHGEILRTPDSPPNSKDLYADNIAYMDKLVGDIVAELEKLKLREKTLVIFVGDNGTARHEYERSTIGGRKISGHKSEMLEGGSLVPMIANWPGTTPPGRVVNDLVDFSDFVPTFTALAGATIPEKIKIDGQSFAGRLQGKKENARHWIFVELGQHWYVRNNNWKLNEAGELFDMTGAPFEEKLVPASNEPEDARAAREKLQATLKELDPAGGIRHIGEASGKHDKKAKKQKKKAAKAAAL